jgi:hypothetical protein
VRGWQSKQPVGRAEGQKPADLPRSRRASSVVCPSLSAFRTFTLAREGTAPQPVRELINALDADGERVKAKVRRRSVGARFSGSPIEVGFRRSAAAGLRNKLRGSRRSAVVQGFGCRPVVTYPAVQRAGVRKPPRQEPAGAGWAVSRLWGFDLAAAWVSDALAGVIGGGPTIAVEILLSRRPSTG